MKHSFQLLHNNKYRTIKPKEREMNEEIPTIAVAHGPKQSRRQDRKGNPTTAKWSHRAKSNRTETWKTEAATAMHKVPECGDHKGRLSGVFLANMRRSLPKLQSRRPKYFFLSFFLFF